ncbi:hypothetical protein [Deefgea salmonis]|uniref:DUF2946 domain-containing protein n=1 Tax=Deefgea salmonis TaxID=2875502 RepID=A0ABS8BP05_9NEIS|nr:hypothetical protein [Deefgea salmonis]MCB5197463.1 hypothetical protein [Deefgea salmonis]
MRISRGFRLSGLSLALFAVLAMLLMSVLHRPPMPDFARPALCSSVFKTSDLPVDSAPAAPTNSICKICLLAASANAICPPTVAISLPLLASFAGNLPRVLAVLHVVSVDFLRPPSHAPPAVLSI